MVTYAADAHDLYGELYFQDRAVHKPGATREVKDWDSLQVLGNISQPAKTYRRVGNINEHQVVIAESTFGGRKELHDTSGGIDYGSMIYIALERATTAREAISIMTSLANEHRYRSKGETFSIADPNEVWIMDLIGKGLGHKGVVWVACKVPDGYVTAHANFPRIRQFPRNDPRQCLYADDVVSFARDKGFFSGSDDEFSFVDAYAVTSCEALRTTEARVWSFFNRVAPSQKIAPDAPLCKPGSKPLPLWIKPDRKLTVKDLMAAMRDHFEDTPFEMRDDVGAGPFSLPYRWRPLRWEFEGKTYSHQRAIATQQTGFSFISQSRAGMPGAVGGVLWFGVDDAASTVYVPMYAGIDRAPKAYAHGTASFEKFSWDSAFWVFNWIANFAYGRYADIIKDIEKAQRELEEGFFAQQAQIEKRAMALYASSPAQASALLTRYSEQASDRVMERWKQLGPALLMKYMDGNIRNDKGEPTHPPYAPSWYRRIVAENGNAQRVADHRIDGVSSVGPSATSSTESSGSPALTAVTSATMPPVSALASNSPDKPANSSEAPSAQSAPTSPSHHGRYSGCDGCSLGVAGAGMSHTWFTALATAMLWTRNRRRVEPRRSGTR